MTRLAGFALGLGLFLSASRAHAEDPVAAPTPTSAAAPTSRELTVACAELDLFAARVKRERAATTTAAVLAGVVLVPTGIVLWTRDSAGAASIGSAMTLSALGPIVLGLLSVATNPPLTRVRLAHEKRKASGVDDAELLRALEADWEIAAEKERKERRLVGALEVVGGLLVTAAGAVLLLAPPMLGMTREQQYEVGAGATGFAVPVIATGVHGIIDRTQEELSWEAHRIGRSGAAPRSSLATGTLAISF